MAAVRRISRLRWRTSKPKFIPGRIYNFTFIFLLVALFSLPQLLYFQLGPGSFSPASPKVHHLKDSRDAQPIWSSNEGPSTNEAQHTSRITSADHHGQSVSELPNPAGACAFRQLNWNSTRRSDRFPNVEERICFYMTRWYDPNFGSSRQWKPRLSYRVVEEERLVQIYWNGGLLATVEIEEDHILNDTPFFVFRNNLTVLEKWAKQKYWVLIVFYASEAKHFVEKFPMDPISPVLFSWGDQEVKADVHVPVVAKWRFNDIRKHTRPVPIIVPLEGGKHYGPLKAVAANDIPWHQKMGKAVWRGTLSGIVEQGKFFYDFDYQNKQFETCMKFPRCRLVYLAQKTGLKDADIGFSVSTHEEMKVVEGVNMMRPQLNMKQQLQYKMIISIEGNDVSTGLKWNLLSNSVVLMPPPEKSIFSMEFLLQPFVHYVPLDVDRPQEAIQWVLDNDSEAQLIAKRATNFIQDLFNHTDSEPDNEAVLQQMADRITALWAR